MNSLKFPPPKQGWPELNRDKNPEPPRECNFKPITCEHDGPCTGCEHAPENLKATKR